METFTKRYELDNFADELIKARLMHRLSAEASFTSPAVVSAEADNGLINYELLDCSLSLMDALAEIDRPRESILNLLSKVGGCLAEIHQVDPPAESVWFERSELLANAIKSRSGVADGGRLEAADDSAVLQHGDFGFTNIFVDDDDNLVIIDASPNHYMSVHPLNVDHREMDMAILISHLVGRSANPVTLGRSAVFGRSMIDAVISGYESSGPTIDRHRLRLYTRAGVDAVRQYASEGSQAHRRAILKPLSAVLSRNIS